MTDLADKVTDEEKAPVDAAIAELKEVLDGDDLEAITSKTEALTTAFGPIAQKAYADAEGAPDMGEAGADAGAAQDDDVVDADFEEVKEDTK